MNCDVCDRELRCEGVCGEGQATRCAHCLAVYCGIAAPEARALHHAPVVKTLNDDQLWGSGKA